MKMGKFDENLPNRCHDATFTANRAGFAVNQTISTYFIYVD